MPYVAEISRANPSCFLFLIDQSGSMTDLFPDKPTRKADGVADAINRLLQNLVLKCARTEGIRDYFQVGVIGYVTRGGPAFTGPLASKDLVPISEIGNMPARVETRAKKADDGAGGIIVQTVRFPIWFDPVASGGTPMCQAFNQACTTIQGWLSQRPECFPPVVIHITDGESTDGDPSQAMQRLTNLCSSDGNTLLFNVHVSSNPNAVPTVFPDSSAQLPDQYARMLFDGASLLTPFMRSVAHEHGHNRTDGARGFILKPTRFL